MNHLPTDGLPTDYLTDWTDGRGTDGWAWGRGGALCWTGEWLAGLWVGGWVSE